MYHVYLDEGGLLGRPKLKIVDVKVEKTGELTPSDINGYYLGHLTTDCIFTLIHNFNRNWKKTPITKVTDDSCKISYFNEFIKDHIF